MMDVTLLLSGRSPRSLRRRRGRTAGEVSAIALLFLLGWGPGSLWGQGTPDRPGPSGAPAAAASDRDPEEDVKRPDPEAEPPPQASPPSPAASEQISAIQLAGLPLNGRSYNQLATLQAGVSDPSGGSSSRGGGSGNLTVVGGRGTSNNFLLDGTNVMDSDNEVPRSAAGVQLGSDAVFEVQVLSSQYGPEYGRGSGGVLNSITRSGTPELHGTFFEYFRNSKLDARNFFDPGPDPTPFKRNQFGATVTGPLWKDRTFFMASYEGLRDRLTETVVNFFPDALSRQGILTVQSGEVIQVLAVNPRVKPYLELYPLPNSTYLGGGIGQNAAPRFLPTNENFFTVRVDHKLADRDSLFVRYTFDDAVSRSPEQNYLWSRSSESRQQYGTLVGTHIFNPRRLISFRLGYTRPVERSDSLGPEIPRSLFFSPTAPHLGSVMISSMTPLGAFPGQPDRKVANTFQFSTDTVMQKGSHAFRVGMEVHRYRWDSETSYFESGQWSFNSLEGFLQGGPQGTNLQVTLPGGDNGRNFRQTLVGMYLQDQVRVGARFQLNLGLRYEFVTVLKEKNGEEVFLPDPLRDTTIQVGPIFRHNPSLRSFAPRLGWRWAPFSGRSTVLQGGGGIYYDQIIGYTVIQRKNTAPFYNLINNPNFDASDKFPDALAGASAPGALPPDVQVMDYLRMRTPTVLRYNFSVQQPLPGQWDAEAAYVGARGNHLLRRYESNLFPAPITMPDGSLFFPDDCLERERANLTPSARCRPGAGPLNPAFGRIWKIGSDAQSFYNTMQLSLNGRPGRAFSVQARYTYSKSVDDDSDHLGFGPTQYGLRRTIDRGLSDFDIRHRVAVSYFWTLPFGQGQRGWKGKLLGAVMGGWRLGGIVSYRRGVPSTIFVSVRTTGYLASPSRPDLIAGQSNNPTQGVTAGCPGVAAGQKLGTPELYYDPCAFSLPGSGTLGNLGRNTVISPSVFNADVSLQKEFSLDARRRLQFRAEFFNLGNHPSFGRNTGGTPVVFSGNSGRRGSSAGRLSQTVTTARQLQFALRFSF